MAGVHVCNMHNMHVCNMHSMHAPLDTTRYGRSMHGQYAFYWNTFL